MEAGPAGLVLGEGPRRRLLRATGGAGGGAASEVAAAAAAAAEGRLWGAREAAWAEAEGADPGAVVLASADALRALGAPSGAPAWVSLQGGRGGRPVALLHCPGLGASTAAAAGPGPFPPPTLWVSAGLAQNLGVRPALLRAFPARPPPSLGVSLLPAGTRGPRAEEVRLSKVLEPSRHLFPEHSSSATAARGGAGAASLVRLEAALRAHFSGRPRWVAPGDLLRLVLPAPGPAASASFRVEAVVPAGSGEEEEEEAAAGQRPSSGGGGWVEAGTCRLELRGVVASPVPPCEACEERPLGALARSVLEAAAPAFFAAPVLEAGGAPALLLHGPGERTAAGAVRAAARALGVGVVEFCCHDLAEGAGGEGGDEAAALEAAAESAARFAPAVLLLRRFDAFSGPNDSGSSSRSAQDLLRPALRVLQRAAAGGGAGGPAARAAVAAGNSSGYRPLVLPVATATSAEDLSGESRLHFTHELEVVLPDEGEREAVLRAARVFPERREGEQGEGKAGEQGRCTSFSLERLAKETPGASAADLEHLAADVAHRAIGEAAPACAAADFAVTDEQVLPALSGLRERASQLIGAPKVPSVGWGDVGGLKDVKEAIVDTFDLPLRHPELFSSGLQLRSGVLLYGPPGTGKTLLAKAVATECTLNFLSVKGPELISMYIGESERNVRDVFRRARQAAPSVIFFDELDALAPARGRAGDSGGVMDRVVSQFLAELDDVQGAGGEGKVFIIGATNRPDLIDPSLLRPGRFDTTLYVGIASDGASRTDVLRALTRKFELAPDVELGTIAARCPKNLTGADLYALCADAWMCGAKRTIASSRGAQNGGPRDARVLVSAADFTAALAQLTPSLSVEEIARYERIRDSYRKKA